MHYIVWDEIDYRLKLRIKFIYVSGMWSGCWWLDGARQGVSIHSFHPVFPGLLSFQHPRSWPIEAEWRIFVSVNCNVLGSDNGMSPGRHQAIIWNNDLLSIGPVRRIFGEIWLKYTNFHTRKWIKMPVKWRSFCFGLDVLTLSKVHLKSMWSISPSTWGVSQPRISDPI